MRMEQKKTAKHKNEKAIKNKLYFRQCFVSGKYVYILYVRIGIFSARFLIKITKLPTLDLLRGMVNPMQS